MIIIILMQTKSLQTNKHCKCIDYVYIEKGEGCIVIWGRGEEKGEDEDSGRTDGFILWIDQNILLCTGEGGVYVEEGDDDKRDGWWGYGPGLQTIAMIIIILWKLIGIICAPWKDIYRGEELYCIEDMREM